MLQTNLRAHKKTQLTSTIKPLKFCLGVTLIELMLSVSISSIFSSIVLVNANEFIAKTRVDSEISRLSRLLYKARYYAINSQNNVVICALDGTNKCTGNWHKELSIFIDNNGNGKFDNDQNERLIATKKPIKSNDKLTYRVNTAQIVYQPTGQLFGLSNGTFSYCPHGFGDKSRGILVARSGRFYPTTDKDRDGIDETRSNVTIKCS